MARDVWSGGLGRDRQGDCSAPLCLLSSSTTGTDLRSGASPSGLAAALAPTKRLARKPQSGSTHTGQSCHTIYA